MFVEIPLIQRFILYLGNPAYAITAILFSLLLFSGIGSQLSSRLPVRWMLAILTALLIILPLLLPSVFRLTLGFSFVYRLVLTAVFIAPIGMLMGMPFPSGIRQISALDATDDSPWIGWAWAVNGAASVLASMLAALLAISAGFNVVFYLGALCYAVALLTFGQPLRFFKARE